MKKALFALLEQDVSLSSDCTLSTQTDLLRVSPPELSHQRLYLSLSLTHSLTLLSITHTRSTSSSSSSSLSSSSPPCSCRCSTTLRADSLSLYLSISVYISIYLSPLFFLCMFFFSSFIPPSHPHTHTHAQWECTSISIRGGACGCGCSLQRSERRDAACPPSKAFQKEIIPEKYKAVNAVLQMKNKTEQKWWQKKKEKSRKEKKMWSCFCVGMK